MISKIGEKIGLFFAELLAYAIGWLWCMVMLVGAFGLGHWLVTNFDWKVDANIGGLLSVLTLIWIYERREAQHRHERLYDAVNRRSS